MNDFIRKNKRKDIKSIDQGIIQAVPLKGAAKEDIIEKIKIVMIDEKLINKLTRNRNFYMSMRIMNVNYILNNEGISFHKYLAKASFNT